MNDTERKLKIMFLISAWFCIANGFLKYFNMLFMPCLSKLDHSLISNKNTVRDPGVRLRTNVFIFSWIYTNFINTHLIKISHMVIEPGHNLRWHSKHVHSHLVWIPCI